MDSKFYVSSKSSCSPVNNSRSHCQLQLYRKRGLMQGSAVTNAIINAVKSLCTDDTKIIGAEQQSCILRHRLFLIPYSLFLISYFLFLIFYFLFPVIPLYWRGRSTSEGWDLPGSRTRGGDRQRLRWRRSSFRPRAF